MTKALRDITVNSLIGEGSEFRGEFKVNGLLRIDGSFTGEIKTKGKVLIGNNGKVHTDIHAGVIVIGGEVHGNIFAEKEVTLLSTGKLFGNVVTPKMLMEEGVIFEGNCHINKPSQFFGSDDK